MDGWMDGWQVSLGSVGKNVGAGMTGGIGYFLDEDGTFESMVNREIVKLQRIPSTAAQVRSNYNFQAKCSCYPYCC